MLVECWSDSVALLAIGDGAGGVEEIAASAVPFPAPAAALARVPVAFRAPVAALAARGRVVAAFGFAAAFVVRLVPDRAADAAGFAAAALLPAALLRAVPDLAVLLAVPDFAVPDLDAADFAVLDLVVPLLAVLALAVAGLDRPAAADVVLRAVPDLEVVPLFFAVVLDRAVDDAARVVAPALSAVVLMALAAESIAFAASAIALVAVVMALFMAVMALADVDAFVATDFICVAAAFAWLAALVTRADAADVVRLDADRADAVRLAGFLAADVRDDDVFVPDRLADIRAVVVPDVDRLAAEVFVLAALDRVAGFFAAVDFFTGVLFARAAVLRPDAVRDAVLVGTDLPP